MPNSLHAKSLVYALRMGCALAFAMQPAATNAYQMALDASLAGTAVDTPAPLAKATKVRHVAAARHVKANNNEQGDVRETMVIDAPVLPRNSAMSGPHFVYHAEGKRLSEVLQDFASSRGMPAVIADGVDGSVTGNFDHSPAKFLNAIATAYSLIWYDDGSALYFYPAKAIQSRMFKLVGYTRANVSQLLKSLALGDQRYPVRYSAVDNVLLVYGPPRHVELLAMAIEALDASAIESNAALTQVFPLRFASAGDQVYGESTVAGMVTTLRSLYSGTPANKLEGAAKGPSMSGQLAGKLKAMYATTGSDKLLPDATTKGDAAAGTGAAGGAPGGRGLHSPVDTREDEASFEADIGTNSVIVHAKKTRMAEYASLIQQLDQRPQLVELEAMIVDVSAGSLDQLGVDWSLQTNRLTTGVTSPSLAGAASGLAPFRIGTLLANAGASFSVQLQALEGMGRARVVSKPKLLGVANRAAMMKEKRVVSVRVSGNLEANLFQVEAGTLLRMTPQPVMVNGVRQIKLTIYIEDGSFEAGTVDQVPVVKKTQIQTEAYVGEGESLLIAGITVESESVQRSGVPGLASLPYVGGLFRSNSQEKTRSERMFLITPRLIAASMPAPAPTAEPAPMAARPAVNASRLALNIDMNSGLNTSTPAVRCGFQSAGNDLTTAFSSTCVR